MKVAQKEVWMTVVAVAAVIGAGAFYGGMRYADAARMSRFQGAAENRQQFGGSGRMGGRNGPVGGAAAGEVIAKDDTSLTIKMPDGGSKIVFYADSTKVTKTVDSGIADVATGSQIFVTGTANSDGSVTAQSIQVRSFSGTQSQINQ